MGARTIQTSKRIDEHAPPRSSPESTQTGKTRPRNGEGSVSVRKWRGNHEACGWGASQGTGRAKGTSQAIVGQDSGGNRSIKPTATLMHVGEHNRDRLSLPRRVIRSRGGGRWPVTATRRERSRRLAHQPKPVEPSVATPKERAIRDPWWSVGIESME
jgi:hypothetical protein